MTQVFIQLDFLFLFLFHLICLVSTPKPSTVLPPTESLGGTGQGTAGGGPPSERENVNFTI